jgi:hypothetical protein
MWSAFFSKDSGGSKTEFQDVSRPGVNFAGVDQARFQLQEIVDAGG